jgi:hypothetical protein
MARPCVAGEVKPTKRIVAAATVWVAAELTSAQLAPVR